MSISSPRGCDSCLQYDTRNSCSCTCRRQFEGQPAGSERILEIIFENSKNLADVYLTYQGQSQTSLRNFFFLASFFFFNFWLFLICHEICPLVLHLSTFFSLVILFSNIVIVVTWWVSVSFHFCLFEGSVPSGRSKETSQLSRDVNLLKVLQLVKIIFLGP